MGKLNEFIIKQLNDSKVQRWIVKATDLFALCNSMGILDDDELMVDIIEYLENNEIDINFIGGDQFYKDFVRLENKVKMGKMLRGSKTEVQLMIEKIDSIKVPERPTWLNDYMVDEENPNEGQMTEEILNQYQRITNMLTQELREQVENEPEITLEEVQREVENEMGLVPPNFSMSQLRGDELIQFLTNRIIPERFRKNNN
jgi:hypothetical protein